MRAIKDYIYYGLHTGIAAVSSIVLIPVYIKGAGVETFGYFSLALALASMFSVLVSFRLPGSALKFMHDHDGDPEWKKRYVSTVALVLFVSCCVGAVLLNYMYPLLLSSFSVDKSEALLSITGATIVIGCTQVMYNVFERVLRAERKSRSVAIAQLLFSLVNVAVAVWLFFAEKLTLSTMLGSHFIALLGATIFVTIAVRQYLGLKLCSATVCKPVAKYALGLYPHAVSKYIFAHLDKFLILYFLGPFEVGLYAVILKVAALYDKGVTVTDSVWRPALLQKRGDVFKADAARALPFSQLVNVSGFLVFCGLAPPLVYILSQKAFVYWQACLVLGVIHFTKGIRNFLVYPFLEAEKTLVVSLSSILSSTVALCLYIALIPGFALWGAVFASLVSSLFGVLLLAILSVRLSVERYEADWLYLAVLCSVPFVVSFTLYFNMLVGYTLAAISLASISFIGYKKFASIKAPSNLK